MYTADLASCAASTSSHNFMTNKKLVKRPSVCEHCLGFCWGLGWKIAVSCTDCKKTIHLSCAAHCEDGCGISRKPSSKRPKLNFNTLKIDNEKSLKNLQSFIDIATTDHIPDEELIALLKNVVSQLNPAGQPKIQSSLLEVILYFRTRVDIVLLIHKTGAQMVDILLNYLSQETSVLTVDTEYLYIVTVACIAALIEDSKKIPSIFQQFVQKGLFVSLTGMINVSSNPEWYRQLYLLQCALLSRYVNQTKIRFDPVIPEHKELLAQYWALTFPDLEFKMGKSNQWTEVGFQTNNPAKEISESSLGFQLLGNMFYIVSSDRSITKTWEDKSTHVFSILVNSIGKLVLDWLLNKKATITLKNARAGGYSKLIHYFLFSYSDAFEQLVGSLVTTFAAFSSDLDETMEKISKSLETLLPLKLMTLQDIEKEIGTPEKSPNSQTVPTPIRVRSSSNEMPAHHKKTISKRKERKPTVHHDDIKERQDTEINPTPPSSPTAMSQRQDGGIKKYFSTFAKKKSTDFHHTKVIDSPASNIKPTETPQIPDDNPRKKPKIQLEPSREELEAGSASAREAGSPQPRFFDAGSSRGEMDSYGQITPYPTLALDHLAIWQTRVGLGASCSGAASRVETSELEKLPIPTECHADSDELANLRI